MITLFLMNTNCLFFIVTQLPFKQSTCRFYNLCGHWGAYKYVLRFTSPFTIHTMSCHQEVRQWYLPNGEFSLDPVSVLLLFSVEISALCQHKKTYRKRGGITLLLKPYPSICPTWVALPRFIGARRRNMTRKPPQRLLPVFRGKILHMPSTYPTVVRVIKAHQNPSQAPLEKHFGNSPEFPLVS